jgi:hypothetical protein
MSIQKLIMQIHLGLFLNKKEWNKLIYYLSQSNKYNVNTKQCIDAAILEYHT